jgi:hypothetical protein
VRAANRYTFQIEIAATPTKQTADTSANRYNLPLFKGASFPLFTGHESRIMNHGFFVTGIRNRRK